MINFFKSNFFNNLSFYSQKLRRNFYLRIVFYYFSFLLVASLFLMLPWSWTSAHANDKSWHFFNSFYMAASAISTTGLTIYDLGEHMSFFGQIIILLCIFVGGMGLLFFKFWFIQFFIYLSRFGFRSFSKKNNLSSAREQHFERGYFRFQYSKDMILNGFLFILFVQFFGFLLLFIYFFFFKIDNLDYYNNSLKSIWSAIFHSVSATNNAGFDIFSDGILHNSLESLQKHYFVQFVFIIQFILGGLGFPIFFELWRRWKPKKEEPIKKIHFFAKFVLKTYFIFLFFSIFIIFLIESLTSDSVLRKEFHFNNLMKVIFNTLSARSAGYSTTNIDSYFTDTSKYFLAFFMWVGCGPISTGGGIKVTTFAILLLSLFFWRVDSQNNFLIKKNKSIFWFDVFIVYKIFLMSLLFIFVSCLIFLLQNKIGGEKKLLNALFQSTSALGNVGLTTLNNKDLIKDSYGIKIITILLMIIGQIGIAQIIWFTSKNSLTQPSVKKNIIALPQEVLF